MLDCDVYLRGSCLKMPTLFRKEGLLSGEVAVSIFIHEQGTAPKDGMNFNSLRVGSELT